MFITGQTIFENDEEHSVLVMGNEDDKCWIFDPFATELILVELDTLSYIKYDDKVFLGKYADASLDGLDVDEIDEKRAEIEDYLIHIDDLISKDKKYEVI